MNFGKKKRNLVYARDRKWRGEEREEVGGGVQRGGGGGAIGHNCGHFRWNPLSCCQLLILVHEKDLETKWKLWIESRRNIAISKSWHILSLIANSIIIIDPPNPRPKVNAAPICGWNISHQTSLNEISTDNFPHVFSTKNFPAKTSIQMNYHACMHTCRHAHISAWFFKFLQGS